MGMDQSPDTFFGYRFQFSGKTGSRPGSGMYGMIYCMVWYFTVIFFAINVV